ncbi:hypothetical protein [Hyperthermus butylicus]|uniref:Uncharacterized protein n=1 Tax=Hyperthermus butylicus (strain DSM 5456 / JCM 9403 / PLM1-5) TaxID=415426 RepID=A2BIY7_HYPBU|nr:hypothetical protein [Hyperthermus butylicus]ABM79948.1 hypothetical protein Hbut_0071 [Hyperthermus butylicus DSM 5456]
MGPAELEHVDAGVGECLQSVRKLKPLLPRRGEPFETYLLEWARFKRQLAEVAAKCLAKFVPNAIKEIYYIDLAEDGVGRDVDLFLVVDESRVNNPEELTETFEAILSKLIHLAGIDALKYTTAPSLFEIHVSKRGIYGSKTLLSNAIRIYP